MKRRKIFNATMGALILMSVGQPIMSMSANSVMADTASTSTRGVWVGDLLAGSKKVSGTAAPGANIYVYHVISSGNSVCIGSTTADSDGNWTAGISALSPNESIQVESSNENGGTHYTPTYSVEYDRPTVGSTLLVGSRTVSGTASPNSNITVFQVNSPGNSLDVGSTTTDTNGHWTITTNQPLAGGKSFQVRSTVDGSDRYSDILPIVYNYVTPTISGDLTEGMKSLSGTATAEACVDVWVNGINVATVQANNDGNWSADLSSRLAIGDTVKIGTVAGGKNYNSDTYTTGHVTPTITDGLTPGSHVSGTGAPGACVDVWENGINILTTTVDSDGNWTSNERLVAGGTVKAVTSIDGKCSTSDTYNVAVKAPTINKITGTWVSGTADPGTQIKIFGDHNELEFGGGTKPIGTGTADGNGNWKIYCGKYEIDYGFKIQAEETGSNGAVAFSKVKTYKQAKKDDVIVIDESSTLYSSLAW